MIDRIKASKPEWFSQLNAFGKSNLRKAIIQITNSFTPYLALWVLMVYMLNSGVSFWLVLPVMVLAAGFLVRIFIVFHDCCHGSFFKSKRANRIMGYVSGVLTFTPFEEWRNAHNIHHKTAGDLDRRGLGDVWVMTVEEYKAATPRRRLAYRLYRNPLVMFGLGPLGVFILQFRIPHKQSKARERRSVFVTDAILLGILVAAALTIGLKTYLLIQLPTMLMAGSMGIWLFYVQHQFEGVHWSRSQEWDVMKAALEGSSFYRLPRVLQWFSGNIGFHHIHHLRATIPNYNLEVCHKSVAAVQNVKALTFWASLKTPWLQLYDEQKQKLISFRALRLATSS